MLGIVPALIASGDCGICFRFDEVEDGVVGCGGVEIGSSGGDVVTVKDVVVELSWICIVVPEGGWMIDSTIGVSGGSGDGTRLGFRVVASSSCIDVSFGCGCCC